MTLKITIGGVETSVFHQGISWSDRLGAVPTANLKLKVAAGGTFPNLRGKEIIISDSVLKETVNVSPATYGPPGIVYETDHEGTMNVTMPYNAHPDGTIEGVFEVLYNLPDISEYVIEDVYVPGAIYNNDISAWIEVGVVWRNATKDYHYYVWMWSHSGETFYKTELSSTTVLELDRAYRLSMTWDTAAGGASCDLKLYIDGVLEDSTTATGTMEPYYEEDAVLYVQGAFAFLGIGYYFSDLRLFYDVRTPEEIETYKFLRLTGAELTDPNLEAYYMLDEMTGTTLTDSGPGEHDAELLPDPDYETYLLWSYSPDPWLPDSDSFCTPEERDYTYFAGYVDKCDVTTEGRDTLVLDLRVEGYASLLERYKVGINFLNPHPGKYYAQYIGRNVVDAWDVGSACIPAGSPTVLVSDWNMTKALSAMNELADSTGWIWSIDPYKEIRFHPRGYRAAPFDITASDSPAKYLADTLKVVEDKDGYFNRLVARFKAYNDLTEEYDVISIVVENAAEIAARMAAEGGDGVYEHTTDLPDALSPEHALDQAYGMITSASTLGKSVSYVTRETGLRVGQAQTITRPDYGLSGQFVIEQIQTTYNGGHLFHSVSLSSWKRPKIQPLSELMRERLASKTNWWENSLVDGVGELLELSEDIYLYVFFTITDGVVADECKWDVGKWDFTDWGD